MAQFRRTKIIATLGPASQERSVICALIEAGVDLVRINFSHGSNKEHINNIQLVRECAKKCGREIGILADLQGPKIRIARFKQSPVFLKPGAQFILDAELDDNAGNEDQVGIDYKDLPNDVHVGDILLLDDGRLEFKVEKIKNKKIICRVIVGGELSNNKGINRQGGGLSAKALTAKDKRDLKTAAEMGVDYIAVSFPRDANDIEQARKLLKQAKSNAGIIAKIERVEAVKNIDAIIKVSDAVMVARGDLGVEMGYAALPAIQKFIIRRARALDKAVITATQMMESMIHNLLPTRAEVSDVANAVLDGTDAVMLSAETATGEHPVRVIEVMSNICLNAEQNPVTQKSKHRMERIFTRVDEAIAMATMYTANHLDIKAIVALTESGSTPLWMSRIRSGIPIYGLSRHVETQRKMTLYRGVYPIHFDATKLQRHEIKKQAVAELEKRKIVKKGDFVILTKGDAVGIHGHANSMKIITVGDVH